MAVKKCNKCGEIKPTTEFYIHKHNRDGRRGECRVCVNDKQRIRVAKNRDRVRAVKKAWRAANKERDSAVTRRRKFGTDGKDLFEQQKGLCGICRADLSNLKFSSRHLDHCHATGIVRGWLCVTCNTREGWFTKNKEAVLAWIAKSNGGK